MRSLEFLEMVLALFGVPLASWLAGRLAGRGNLGVFAMLLISLVVTAALQALLLFQPAALGLGARPGPREMMVGGPEFSAFLFVFGAFITLVGWAGTPARTARS